MVFRRKFHGFPIAGQVCALFLVLAVGRDLLRGKFWSVDDCFGTCAACSGYQDKLRMYQSSRLRTRTFREGDLVLRLIQEKVHKLAPQWETHGTFCERPFIISEVIGGGAYRLKNPKTDEDVGNPRNVANLRLFYPLSPSVGHDRQLM